MCGRIRSAKPENLAPPETVSGPVFPQRHWGLGERSNDYQVKIYQINSIAGPPGPAEPLRSGNFWVVAVHTNDPPGGAIPLPGGIFSYVVQ